VEVKIDVFVKGRFIQMLELSLIQPEPRTSETLGVDVAEEACLQFQETLRALGQLTSLHLSNVDYMLSLNVLPADNIGSLKYLRCMSHLLTERSILASSPAFNVM
jgi:hypothetical protein